MVILLMPIMQGNGPFLKKINKFMLIMFRFFLPTIIVLFSANSLKAQSKEKIHHYMQTLNNFSSSFIQTENSSNSEGKLFANNSRIKIKYSSPSNIVIIIAKNKGMYFNQDLEEVEFFNPKDSVGKIFYNVFFNQKFLDNATFIYETSYSIIKKIISFNNAEYEILLYFENKPIKIRKIKIIGKDYKVDLGIYNIELNQKLDAKFFSMISPLIN